jgi:ribosomal protein S27AE
MPAKAETLRQETQALTKKPKYCPYCGAFLGDRTEKIKFCPNCGEKIA